MRACMHSIHPTCTDPVRRLIDWTHACVHACIASIQHVPTLPLRLQTANRGRLGARAPGEPEGAEEKIDLSTTLSKPFIERIWATQRLAAGERGNGTMEVMAGVAGGGGVMERSDSPAPLLLGRESSVESTVSGVWGGESVPLVRGSGGGSTGAQAVAILAAEGPGAGVWRRSGQCQCVRACMWRAFFRVAAFIT